MCFGGVRGSGRGEVCDFVDGGVTFFLEGEGGVGGRMDGMGLFCGDLFGGVMVVLEMCSWTAFFIYGLSFFFRRRLVLETMFEFGSL